VAETGTAEKRTKREAVSETASDLGGLKPELLKSLLSDMLLYRRFEEKAEEAYATSKDGGSCHLHIGQEGAAAGTIAPLRDEDYVITAYRDHTQALAKGIHPNAVMAELYGRAPGTSGGKGGSMHIFGAAQGFMGGHGIVGQQVGLATGFGWAIKYRKQDRVCVCFLGDAAVNQGAFHEGLNMAAIWSLPVIFVVENNAYGMGTAFTRVSTTDMTTKAIPYGIATSQVDGQDVVATYTHLQDLIDEVRSGGGPRFVDAEEVDDKVEGSDPIRTLADRLMGAGLLDQAELEEMDAKAKQISQEAADFAESAPAPDPKALYAHVYAEINEHGRLFFDGRDRGEQ